MAAEEDAPLKAVSPVADAHIKRKVEIHLMGLDKRAARGDRDAKADAIKIRYGLEIHASSQMQCIYALKAAGVDLNRLSNEMRN